MVREFRKDVNDMATEYTQSREENSHPDPITGAPGFHPIGTGVGATGGGLAGAGFFAARRVRVRISSGFLAIFALYALILTL